MVAHLRLQASWSASSVQAGSVVRHLNELLVLTDHKERLVLAVWLLRRFRVKALRFATQGIATRLGDDCRTRVLELLDSIYSVREDEEASERDERGKHSYLYQSDFRFLIIPDSTSCIHLEISEGILRSLLENKDGNSPQYIAPEVGKRGEVPDDYARAQPGWNSNPSASSASFAPLQSPLLSLKYGHDDSMPKNMDPLGSTALPYKIDNPAMSSQAFPKSEINPSTCLGLTYWDPWPYYGPRYNIPGYLTQYSGGENLHGRFPTYTWAPSFNGPLRVVIDLSLAIHLHWSIPITNLAPVRTPQYHVRPKMQRSSHCTLQAPSMTNSSFA